MNINQRIRELRKCLALNQKEFGEKIGMGQAGVSKLEQDGNTVIDQNIRLICDTFQISEEWLRTGKGDMKADDDDIYIKKLAARYQLPGSHAAVMEAWLTLSNDERETILALIRKVTGAADAAERAEAERVKAIDEKVAAYRQELEAQQKGPSVSATGSAAMAGTKKSRP